MGKNHLDDPEKTVAFINQLENAVNQPMYDLTHPEDIKIQFRADESVAPCMFKPDPLIPNGYIANSLTLRAMRPNIFVLGDSLDDLECLVQCVSCSKSFDLQFWKLCPHCGSETKGKYENVNRTKL